MWAVGGTDTRGTGEIAEDVEKDGGGDGWSTLFCADAEVDEMEEEEEEVVAVVEEAASVPATWLRLPNWTARIAKRGFSCSSTKFAKIPPI
jgi:hypothetical protein